jgi:uncharacterized hydantoinase/oxoprolinase family protein
MEQSEITPVVDKDLLRAHKALLEEFMKNELHYHVARRNKIIRIYEAKVDENNIRIFYNRSIEIFLKALLLNKLNVIGNYFPKDYSFNKEQLSGPNA